MKVNLAKKVYPIEYLLIAKAEFADKLLIEAEDSSDNDYTILINILADGTKIKPLTAMFLNRFLEISIIEQFG